MQIVGLFFTCGKTRMRTGNFEALWAILRGYKAKKRIKWLT